MHPRKPSPANHDGRSYADRTRNDPSLIKRMIHSDRFAEARRLAQSLSAGQSILDYGAGDGEFMKWLHEEGLGDQRLVAYEPAPTMLVQLRANLAESSGIEIVTAKEDLPESQFDCVLCLEVLEHLPENELGGVLKHISLLLRPGGTLIVAVPHELYLPALLKGAFRMIRRWGADDAKPASVLRATLGLKVERKTSTMGDGLPYHFEHIGFDYRELQTHLSRYFELEKRYFRPFPLLGAALNSEVYFVLRPRPPESNSVPVD